jgi:hypothetical protein
MLEAIEEHNMGTGERILAYGLLFGFKRLFAVWGLMFLFWGIIGAPLLNFVNPWIIANNEKNDIISLHEAGWPCAHYIDDTDSSGRPDRRLVIKCSNDNN